MRQILRSLRRTPVFTSVAALTMALGIAGTTAIYAAFETLLLRPLALPEGDRLVRLWQINQSGHTNTLAPATLLELLRAPSLERGFGYEGKGANLSLPEGPERILLTTVTAGFLETLRVRPQSGRDFLAEEGADRVLLTDAAWRRRFGGSADVLGRSLRLDGQSVQVIGVLPRDFVFTPMPDAEGFLPLRFSASEQENRATHKGLRAIGRLAPGATLERLDDDLSIIARRLETEWPAENARWGAKAFDLRDDLPGGTRQALVFALLASGLLLVLACANVAGMLIARGASRQRELAVRAALGGSSGQLFRQLIAESAVLGVIGGALGLLMARWALDGLLSLLPSDTPRLHEIHLDARLCALAAAVSLLSGIAAGVVPALQVNRRDLLGALHGSDGPLKSRARAILVVAQIALALVLVTSAGLFARSLQKVFNVDPGLDARGLVAIGLSFPESKAKSSRQIAALHAQILERVANIPGVEAAGATSALPFAGTSWYSRFSLEGSAPAAQGHDLGAAVQWVSPSWRGALRIKLIAGRDLSSSDTPESPRVILVNEAFARRYSSAIGARIRIHESFFTEGEQSWEIAGVIGDVRQNGLDRRTWPAIFISQTQQGRNWTSLVVRSRVSPGEIARAVRAEILAIDPQQPLGRVYQVEDLAGDFITGRRVQALVFGLAGALGLLLASLGIYGIVDWSVVRRTREIGIRQALGAERSKIFRLILLEGGALAAAGLGIGLFASFFVSRAIRSGLYEVDAIDPLTYLTACSLLSAVVLLACLLPARRATRISPLVALQSE